MLKQLSSLPKTTEEKQRERNLSEETRTQKRKNQRRHTNKEYEKDGEGKNKEYCMVDGEGEKGMILKRKEHSCMTALTLKSLLEFGFQVFTLNYGKFIFDVTPEVEGCV